MFKEVVKIIFQENLEEKEKSSNFIKFIENILLTYFPLKSFSPFTNFHLTQALKY